MISQANRLAQSNGSNMSCFNWICILFFLGLINFIIGLNAMNKFLSQNKSFNTYQDLEQFKSMVRKQMYQALVQIVFLGGMAILGIVGFLIGKMNTFEFLMFLIFNGINVGAGKYGKETERRIRTLSIENLNIRAEYNSICKTWGRKAFPSF